MELTLRRAAAGLVVALALSGCGDSGVRGVGGEPGTLDGRTLVVTEVHAGGAPRPLVRDSQVRLEFEAGHVRLTGGCNILSADYALDGDRLALSGLGGTEMGCAEPLMEQDAWLTDLFAGPVTFTTEPLQITSGDVVLSLADREDVAPDAPLTGTRWVLDSLIEGETVSSVGVEAHLTIGRNGRVELFGGCNGAGGDVEVGAESLVWGSLVGTLKACEDERGEVERFIGQVLRGRTTYDVTEQRLTVTRGDQGLGFRATG